MGHGIAKNLLQAGYPLAVIEHRNRAGSTIWWSAEPPKFRRSPNYLWYRPRSISARRVEAIVTELLPPLAKGTIAIDCWTSDPTPTVTPARSFENAGGHMADAPLGGTPAQADAGELAAMVGAGEEVFERLKPILAAWAKSIAHV